MATSKTTETQDILVAVGDFIGAASNDDIFGDTKQDSTDTTAGQITDKPGQLYGNGIDDIILALVNAIDTRATTITSDATVTTIDTVKKFSDSPAADLVIVEDEMWRLEVTCRAIAGTLADQTLWQRRVWHVSGRTGASFTADVVENDGPHFTGANLVGSPGLTLDLTGGKMILKVQGLVATTTNWEVTYTQRSYNKQ